MRRTAAGRAPKMLSCCAARKSSAVSFPVGRHQPAVGGM